MPASGAQAVDVSGTVTAVGQAAAADSVRDEVVSSFDVFVDVATGRGRIHAYVEGNTTPFSDGVSRRVPGSNADAGTALGAGGRGRVQLSELRLVWPVGPDLRAHVGLLDVTGVIDVSRIANDENLFFLATPFVNNPTIGFPDYTLGVALEGSLPVAAPLTVGVVATESYGIADDGCACYSSLFDFNGQRRGVFLGTALRWERSAERVSLGGWLDTADRPRVDGSGEVGRGRGVFAVVGHAVGIHTVSVRAGLADGDVAETRAFVGLTYLLAAGPHALGLAAGRAFPSPALEQADDVTRFEAFFRRRVLWNVFATASVQRVVNAGFDAAGTSVSPRLWIAGLRLSAQF